MFYNLDFSDDQIQFKHAEPEHHADEIVSFLVYEQPMSAHPVMLSIHVP